MNLYTRGPRSTGSGHSKTPRVLAWLLPLFAAGLVLTLVSGAAAAPTAVPLATSGSFAVLAGSGITNTGPTTLNGDVGTFPTTSETGTGSMTVTGTNHAGDTTMQGAKNDLVTAYNTAAGEGPTSPIGPGSPIVDLGGQTLLPGVYNSASSIGLTGALTLNAQGDPDAVFVFQAGSTLTTASASQINLINGAQACNVFWQIGSSAGLGTGSTFRRLDSRPDRHHRHDRRDDQRARPRTKRCCHPRHGHDHSSVLHHTDNHRTTTTTDHDDHHNAAATATATTTAPTVKASNRQEGSDWDRRGTEATHPHELLGAHRSHRESGESQGRARQGRTRQGRDREARRPRRRRQSQSPCSQSGRSDIPGRATHSTDGGPQQALAATAAAAKATALTKAAARETAATKLARKRAIATT